MMPDIEYIEELVAKKSVADALINLIRTKKESYSEISRAEIELLYVLYCEQAGEEK